MDRVCCANCGFYAAFRTDTRQFEEADEAMRSGSCNVALGAQTVHGMHVYFEPMCFARVINMSRDMSKEGSVAVITKERDCPKFTPWMQGYSPKDHQEMIQTTNLLKAQEQQRETERKWQEEQRQADRAWQEKQRHEDLEWRRQDREWQEKHKKFDRLWLVLSAVVGAIIAFVFTLIGSKMLK